MYKIKNYFLEKHLFVKNFISGIKLKGEDIKFFLKNKLKLKFCNIRIDNNNIIFIYNNKEKILLLNKKEIIIIKNFLHTKKYNCIPIKILKINSFYKLKISIIKKGMKGVDV